MTMETAGVSPFDAAAILVALAAVFGYLNYRFLHFPQAIGLTVMGAVASLAVVAADALVPGFGPGQAVRAFLRGIDFETTLMEGMLSFLLFAGAMHVNLAAVWSRRWTVLSLATAGVLISTALVGLGFMGLGRLAGLDIPLLWCLVFGALISPTDPVAVLGLLKSARVPESLEAKVAGESLFNDGVGVVVFSIVAAAAVGGGELSPWRGAELFLVEAGGGALLGLAVGWLGYWAMRGVDEYNLEILITLAIVMGGYSLAGLVHVSGPLAMAVAGLFIGNRGVRFAMSETTRTHLLGFWSLIDEILNSVLFLLIGLEVVAIAARQSYLLIGVAAIVLVLLARAVAVGVPMTCLRWISPFTPGAFPLLVWGGLRGGISIALALSLPGGPMKELILTVTYVVVVFSVVVQGGTVGAAARRFLKGAPSMERPEV